MGISDLYQPVKDLCLNRYPLKINLCCQYYQVKPIVVIEIINQTPDVVAYIHNVRVHFGMDEFNRAFVFTPDGETKLLPKQKKVWQLIKPSLILVRTKVKDPDKIKFEKTPGIDHPRDLYKAICETKGNVSWVEIDFNEYKNRKYLMGKVQPIFELVRNQRRELDRKDK